MDLLAFTYPMALLPSSMPRLFPLVPATSNAAVWRADERARAAGAVLPTGHAALDAQLPGGGWPLGAMVEILQAQSSQNEWRLLLPALARSNPGPVVLVGSPHMPFGPALAAQGLAPERLLWITAIQPAERLWACEQALRCAEVAAVLAWLPQARADPLRRLQMAASEHAKLLFVMRPARAQSESSPAVLRLRVSVHAGSHGLQLDILKRRGPPATQALVMPARNGRLAALLAQSQAGAGRRPGRGVGAAVMAAAPGGTAVPHVAGAGDALDRVAGTA